MISYKDKDAKIIFERDINNIVNFFRNKFNLKLDIEFDFD